MKKKIIVLLIGALMVSSLTACGGSKDNNRQSGDKVTLRVATWREQDKQYYEEIEKRFEEKYDWIDVQLEFNSDEVSYEKNIQTDLVTQEAADVLDMHAGDNMQMYGEYGLVVDQSDMEWVKNCDEAALNVCTYDNKTYAFPNNYNYFGFIYNKSIFEKVGVEIPYTPEELVAAVKKLKDAGYGGIIYSGVTNGTNMMRACLTSSMGTENYNKLIVGMDDGSVTDVTSVAGFEEGVKTVEYYTQNDIWYTAYKATSYEPALSLFAQEKSAIMYVGSYLFGERDNFIPDMDAGFFAIPTYADNQMSYAEPGQCTLINANSEHIDEAKLWVEFLATPEISEYYCTNAKMFSTIKGVEPTFEEADMLLKSAKGVQFSKGSYLHNAEWWQTEWNNLLEGVFWDGKDAKPFIDALNAQLKKADIANSK